MMVISPLKIITHYSATFITHLEDDNMNNSVVTLLVVSKKENSKYV